MSESNDRFQDVNEFVPNWSPRQSGSKKDNNVVKLEPTEKSWILGFYLGSRKITIPPKTDEYTIHKMRVTEGGDPSQLAGEIVEGGTDHEFFGTGVLDSTLAEKIAPGQHIRIQWLGLKQPKTATGRPYQDWKVQIDTQTSPITVQNGVVVSSNASSEKSMVADTTGATETAPANAGVVDDDLDELPF